MSSEEKIIIAFLFNRSGKTALKEAEIYLPLSIELGWFSTKEAQAFIKYAMTRDLLIEKEGLLHPNFPVDKTAMPVGFTPSRKIYSAEQYNQKTENMLEDIVTHIATQTNRRRQDLLEEVKSQEKEKNILPEVAAIYIARKNNVDIVRWYDALEHTLLTEKIE